MSLRPPRHAIGFFQCDPQKSSSSITNQELSRNQNFQPCPRPAESEILERYPEICVLISLPGDFDACSGLRTTVMERIISLSMSCV